MKLIVLSCIALAACTHAQAASSSSVGRQLSEPVAAPVTPPGATIISAEVAPPPAFAPASLYFDYDSSELSPAARAVLQSFFDQAQKRPEQNILIEGNCDERGTREYNLALGQQRADAAKKYLAGLGLDAGRISAVSNGKERALATAGEPEAWSKDRRDDLIPVRSGAVLSAAIDDEW